MAGSFGGSGGCSLLVWVDSSTLGEEQMEGDQSHNKEDELLQDAVCLLGTRWGIEFSMHSHGGVSYAFGVQSRYTIGVQTALRALGDLSMHVRVHRGGQHDTAMQLIRYQECRRKYNVPETVHEGTYGEESRDTAMQQQWPKKRRQ